MYDQLNRANRNSEHRRVTIVEVNPSKRYILARDRYNRDYQISFDFHGSVIDIPSISEIWLIKSYNLEWRLDRKLEKDVEKLDIGDKKIKAVNSVFIEGAKVFINDIDTSTYITEDPGETPTTINILKEGLLIGESTGINFKAGFNMSISSLLHEDTHVADITLAMLPTEFIKITEIELLTDATFSFTGLPQTFRHLLGFASLRSDLASTEDEIGVQFNGISSAAYNWGYGLLNGATPLGFGTASPTATMMKVGIASGNNAANNLFTALWFWIPSYIDTTRIKTIQTYIGFNFGGSRYAPIGGGGTLEGGTTPAISRLDFIPANGGTNWKLGSRISLYGAT